MDFDALDGLDMSNLGFGVLYPLRVGRDSFVSTSKNSSNFYLKEDSIDANKVSFAANEDVAPTIVNCYATLIDDADQ